MKRLKQAYAPPPPGQFALDSDRGVQWDSCRERFAAKFNELVPGFFFSHPPGKSANVSAFITKFETVLAVNTAVQRSAFKVTNCDTVVWSEPSVFWSECPLKRSLFTILLRCGFNYCPVRDDFDAALFGDSEEAAYTRETRSATMRFLFGFTRWSSSMPFTGSFSYVMKHGWREEFTKLDDAAVRGKLLLPHDQTRPPSVVGLESLWC